MKKKILIISNPCSGRNKRNSDLKNALEIFRNHGYDVTVMETTKAGDATEYAKNSGSDYDIVVCIGGDGTFCETMNGIMELDNKPEIGFVSAGTTNDFANTIGLSTNSREAVRTIITEPTRPCDLGSFNGRYFTYVASFGAFTRCAYATSQKLKNKSGRLAYFYGAAKDVKDIKSVPMRCVVDGVEFEGNFMFGSISNSLTVGKIIHLDKKTVCLNDGKFEVLFAENPGTVKGWLKLAKCVFSGNLKHESLKLLQGSSVTVETIDGSGIPWTIDGEFAGNVNSVNVEVFKHAFVMHRPPLYHERACSDKTEIRK